MRQQRTERMSTPAPMSKSGTRLPTKGYALIVDGQVKRDFSAQDTALEAAKELKGRFPKLQIKIYDGEKKQDETIELAAA
jgi:hypothetical protein